MTATTQDRNTPANYLQRQTAFPLAADADVPAGVIVAVAGATGLVPTGGSSDTAGMIVVGRSEHSADEADGDTDCQISRGVFGFAMTAALLAVAQANVGKTVYLEDNQTVGLASDTVAKIPAGRLEWIGDDGYAYVSIGLGTETAPGTINGSHLANVADAQLLGGVPQIHVITVADVASGDTDLVVTEKCEVIKAWVQKINGAGAANTATLKNGATAITAALACAVDNTITEATTLDDAATVIAAGGTLRVSHVKAAGTADLRFFVMTIKRA
jgi:hypothetical protein